MAQKRKLQVFVSSTFTDLKEERQAAVEAILTAGHIPAGMELFSAGDQSQMTVIQRWIDESDVYLLLLGGRYGSIETQSQKSYTHLEFEYAIKAGKAYFAVVIDEAYLREKVKKDGVDIWENDNPQKLKDFRAMVTAGQLVKFWTDLRDIKLAIIQTLSEFDRRSDLIGWVPGSEVMNSGAIAEELARLTKENAELRSQVSKPVNNTLYNGLTFDEMYSLMSHHPLMDDMLDLEGFKTYLPIIANIFGDLEPTIAHLLFAMNFHPSNSQAMTGLPGQVIGYIHRLAEIGILTIDKSRKGQLVSLTKDGQQFSLRLQVERDVLSVHKAFAEKLSGLDWNVIQGQTEHPPSDPTERVFV